MKSEYGGSNEKWGGNFTPLLEMLKLTHTQIFSYKTLSEKLLRKKQDIKLMTRNVHERCNGRILGWREEDWGFEMN